MGRTLCAAPRPQGWWFRGSWPSPEAPLLPSWASHPHLRPWLTTTLCLNPSPNSPALQSVFIFTITGLSTFSSDASPFLMLTVKPLPLSTLSVLSLLLRFHQKYLTWQLITVHFLAEDRADIEADYYQIGTSIITQTLALWVPTEPAKQSNSPCPSPQPSP